METNIENPIWSEEDEIVLLSRLKHLIKVLELKKNRITLQEYIRFVNDTKSEFERQMYIKRLTELLEWDEL